MATVFNGHQIFWNMFYINWWNGNEKEKENYIHWIVKIDDSLILLPICQEHI